MSNEAAEQLRKQFADADPSQTRIERWRLDAALATERRATVERCEKALRGYIAAEIDKDTSSSRWRDGAGWVLEEMLRFLAILDAEAAR